MSSDTAKSVENKTQENKQASPEKLLIEKFEDQFKRENLQKNKYYINRMSPKLEIPLIAVLSDRMVTAITSDRPTVLAALRKCKAVRVFEERDVIVPVIYPLNRKIIIKNIQPNKQSDFRAFIKDLLKSIECDIAFDDFNRCYLNFTHEPEAQEFYKTLKGKSFQGNHITFYFERENIYATFIQNIYGKQSFTDPMYANFLSMPFMYGMYPFPYMFGVPMNFQGLEGMGNYPYPPGGKARDDEDYDADYYQDRDGWKDQNYYYGDRKRGARDSYSRDQERDYGGKKKNTEKNSDRHNSKYYEKGQDKPHEKHHRKSKGGHEYKYVEKKEDSKKENEKKRESITAVGSGSNSQSTRRVRLDSASFPALPQKEEKPETKEETIAQAGQKDAEHVIVERKAEHEESKDNEKSETLVENKTPVITYTRKQMIDLFKVLKDNLKPNPKLKEINTEYVPVVNLESEARLEVLDPTPRTNVSSVTSTPTLMAVRESPRIKPEDVPKRKII